jgi:hypothetical protein
MKCRIQFPPGIKFLGVNRTGDVLVSAEIEPVFYKADSRVPLLYLTSETNTGQVMARATVSMSGKNGHLLTERQGEPVDPCCEGGEVPPKGEQPAHLRRASVNSEDDEDEHPGRG